MEVKIYILNSFAKNKNGGNPAGVVIDNYNLTGQEMQKIANKIGFSEIAFIQESNIADFKLRFFTPNSEVDLCGHATIAAFSLMKDLNLIDSRKYLQETNAGILSIEVNDNGFVFMEQNLPSYYEVLSKKEISSCLNLNEDDIVDDLPIQIISTGLRDILIPVKNIEKLNSIKPNLEMIKAISNKHQVVGIHAFTLHSIDESTAHCRNFAPLYGINEESATGTSNGALACYLSRYNKIKPEEVKNIKIEQGYIINQPSEILIKLDLINKQITKVQVGGTAYRVNEKEINT